MERSNDQQKEGAHWSSSSSSSLSTELFGTNSDSNSTRSTGLLGSVFQSQSSVSSSQAAGREFSPSEASGSWRKQVTGHPTGNPKQASTEVVIGSGESKSKSESESESGCTKGRSRGYVDDAVEPCFLSSSLYSGGRGICSHSPNSRTTSAISHVFKEGGEEDPNGGNLNSTSRGNWWKGSLYY